MPRLLLDGRELEASSSQTLLDSFQAGGVPWRESCRNGVCGVCACQLFQGKVDYLGRQPHALDNKDRRAGQILPCIAYPASELLEISLPAYPLDCPQLTNL
ncbi:2Fe-2S iron-sulfur cluster-binding protein [Marinospirillum sp.]|uniref:2Fe-2S iron-sulfur cluster-binding protein n=1 Tax=Marinospirillum sp. TaxID=2183934 RepID=UPI00384FC459